MSHGIHPGTSDDSGELVMSAPAGPLPRCEFRMETFPAGCSEIVILWVAGVVDLSTYRSLSTALAGCVDLHPRYLVVDLSAITFCGVRGMTLLGDTARVTDGVARVAVSGLSACLDRVATMLWEPGLPTRTRSVAVAVTAFRAEQAQHEETLRG